LYLFKLTKKPNTIERKDNWRYNPFKFTDNPFAKDKELTLYKSDYTDTRSEYTIRCAFNIIIMIGCINVLLIEFNTRIGPDTSVTSLA